MRLDVALVERGLARSRGHASELIDAQRVLVAGKPARKASQEVADEIQISVAAAEEYVSRAGLKLAKALDAFSGLEIAGRRALDVGASTGGFTDVLLRRGARSVIALDVGHDQLVDEIRNDARVTVLEGFNARELTPQSLAQAIAALDEAAGNTGAVATAAVAKPAEGAGESVLEVDLIVADLSFISLTLVLEQLKLVAPRADMVLLIKPQFEVGKQSLNASGIVNDWSLRAKAIHQVIDCAQDLGLGIREIVRSELPGTHGNIEYVLWISSDEPVNRSKWSDKIEVLAKEQR